MATYDLTSSIPSGNDLDSGDILNCPYSGSAKSITLPAGIYKLECWGAQGGYRSSTTYGGKGGYSYGTLTLEDETKLYLYAGGSGNSVSTASSSIYPGGFNGGGYRRNYKGGGGGSDIRIGSNSLYARVIVAGGGGSDGGASYLGGAGGGTSGIAGQVVCGTTYGAGTQTASGSSTLSSQVTTNSSSVGGGFGFGGFGAYRSSGYGGAGGGGWYGGSGTYPDGSGDDDSAGSGGSGYVYTSSTASNYPSGCLLNSDYYLTDASTVAGNTSFIDPDTGSSTTGRAGNGYVRITVIETDNGNIIDVTKTELTEDMIVNDAVFKAPYTGSSKEITLPRGRYKFECWGAQGGDATYSSNNYSGGNGGYSAGIIDLEKETKLYLYVGGKGSKCSGATTAGGFNGGGAGYGNSSYICGSGGGGTDIRIDSTSLYARVIVAGGGGGAESYNYPRAGSPGGGETGGQHCPNSSYYAYGATISGAGSGSGGNGSFGTANTSNGNAYGTGGGGGWYGGGNNYYAAAGGGSGYIYSAETAHYYPSGCLLNPSYYMIYPQMRTGDRSGNGQIKITVLEVDKKPIKKYNIRSAEISTNNLKKGDMIISSNCDTNDYTRSIKLPKGKYKLECWGARGGYIRNNTAINFYDGGRGGYSAGTLTLTSETNLFLNCGSVGGVGSNSLALGGQNGGGNGYGYSAPNYAGAGGGGSDIRIGSNSLYARVIVAGGGGGANYYNYGTTGGNGGAGGGTTGGRGYYNSSYYGNGGSQTAAGTSNYATGGFGCGSLSCTSYVAGGGGGWYSGGQGQQCPGGGGSGYVYTSSTAGNYPSGCLLNSNYYLTDTSMKAGDNTVTMDGRIYITVLEIEESTSNTYDLTSDVFNPDELLANDIIDCNYTGTKKTIKLPRGRYKIECWGAQGGDANVPSNYNLGGNGGYSTGIINLTNELTTLYLYAGGKGRTCRASNPGGGFNGGGAGYGYNSNYFAGSGGGGTDVRIGQDSLYSRVIVAGGGGGANSYSGYNTASYPAGKGGGTSGTSCYYSSSYYGNGGSQTAAGTGNYTGSFGTGSTSTTSYSAGGGGGWYPGGNAQQCSGGGGSGYVYNSTNATNYPSGCLLNSDYYLEEASTTTLSSNAPANGKIRITVLEIIYDYNIFDITKDIIDMNTLSVKDRLDCPYSEFIQSLTFPPGEYKLECWGSEGMVGDETYAGKGGYSTGIIHLTKKNNILNFYTGINGGTSDIRINTRSEDDRVIIGGGNGGNGFIYNPSNSVPSESALTVASYIEDGNIINDNEEITFKDPETNKSVTGRSGDGYIRVTVLDILPQTSGDIYNVYEIPEDNSVKNNDILNCSYIGEAKPITLPKGKYKVECWGASGGDADSLNKGGLGGYSKANIILPDTTTLYLYAGGKGLTAAGENILGGFNGGGSGYGSLSNPAGSGGGGTDIRIGNDSLYSRVIVAGGGGGANSYTGYDTEKYPAGTGGGEKGSKCYYDSTYYGNGGSQTAAGTGNAGTGSFGTASTATTTNSAGGGGGWYPGGNSTRCSAGGGSGFTYNEDTEYIYPEGCTLRAVDYLLSPEMTNGLRSGNGKIRITVEELGYEITRYNVSNHEEENVKLKNDDILICTYRNENNYVDLPAGKYKLECWGAQGGDASYSTNEYSGGKGGYSTGIINLSKETRLYLYVGGKGSSSTSSIRGGFNGGGAAYGNGSYYVGSGGGGTDIRIGSTSLYSRVIVAGGGGGAQSYNYPGNGGGGGGITGTTIAPNSSYYSNGGTQTAPGTGQYSTGTFGTASNATTSYVTGGGGGWYPAGNVRYAAGGGGSGYVYNEANAVNYPDGCLLTPEYYLSDAETITSDKTGNGKIIITCLDIDTDYNVYDLNETTPTELANKDKIRCSYSGEVKSVTLPKGRYKLECWGARGGSAFKDNIDNKGGRGGYTSGKLILKDSTTLYLYTGGKGNTTEGGTDVLGGFNGGGSAKGYSGYPAGSGGGGTDIRLRTDSLYSRVIVAGGGGGANTMYNTTSYAAGTGGGNNGSSCFYNSSYYGSGGTQSAAGNGSCSKGTFGTGSTGTADYSAGGGGGWYPGGNSTRCSAGGGSAYTYSEDSQYNYPEGCTLVADDYLLYPESENDIRDGNGQIVITVEELGYELTRYDITDSNFDVNVIKKDDILICPYSGTVKDLTLPKGRYKIECWGAQGGDATYNYVLYPGGKGGYSTGKLNIYKPTLLYLYAGGKGQQCTGGTKTGGFNGGGSGYGYSSYYAGSGGGGTDVRIGTDSLYSRVIVAGGGGGANTINYSSTGGYGGAGGNEIGERRFYSTSYYSNGGNRVEAGRGNYNGTFGTGSTSTTSYVAGGGGGWYPGANAQQCPAGGGSSYIFTEDTEGYYPEGCLLTEDYYIDNPSMQRGIKSDNGKIYITVEDLNIEEPVKDYETYEVTTDTIDTTTLNVGDVINCRYSGAYKELTLPAGKYKLECWGAQGGSTNDYLGGKGGYSTGKLTIKEDTKLYLYAGGNGKLCLGGSMTGGFNGGGTGYGYSTYYAGSGGGGTDIRISTSLYARLIVAGGGGGANDYNEATTGGYGGYGGGENGERRFFSTSYYATGGSLDNIGVGNYSGSFGTASTSSTSYVAGGGGGWYPGANAQQCAAAGGSGYVYANGYTSLYPSGCLLNSSHLLDDTSMEANVRKGHGKIRITVEELGIIEDTDNIYDLNEVSELYNLQSGDIINCNYTGEMQKITLPAGKYKLECWGAQGGHGSESYLGGKGGYSTGIISLNKEFTDLYLYTGGRGKTCPSTTKTGGFNGSGSGYGYACYPAGSGGGGTDIRIDSISKYARVIVAGGGGGANVYNSIQAGTGGGNEGGSCIFNETYYSNGGSQIAAGTSNYATGSFGTGSTTTTSYVAGGGGGWYPGGQGQQCAAAGGSGYVYNEDNSVNYPDGCLLTSDLYLEEASTTNGIHNGDGKIRITVIEAATYINLASDDVEDLSNVKQNDILTCPYTGTATEITLPKGIYKLECWGAQGGDANETYVGGLGGYSIGILKIFEDTKFYLYAGGKGKTCTGGSKTGGFNGGGSGYGYSSAYAGSGGGGTDIRIGEDSLYARLIVAGGGGGANTINTANNGGAGGGTTGGNGYYNSSYYGNGGSQTAAGTSNYATGTFGIASTSNTSYVAGGGGGWYPGGQGQQCPGGGGSGYVYDETNSANYPEGCLLDSGYYLKEASTNSSNRAGNGEIRITVLKRPLPMLMRTADGWDDKAFNLFIKTERGWEEVFGDPNEYFDITSSTYVTKTTIE